MSEDDEPIGVKLHSDGELEWNEEDIEEFKDDMDPHEEEWTTDKEKSPIAGVVWTGIVLVSLTIYVLYVGYMDYSILLATLLVILALGNKAIR